MVASLDLLCVQVLTRHEDKRVRRIKTLAEIEGIDQRTGELDYSNTFAWNAEEDAFRQRNSDLLEEIQADRGWTRSELLSELKDRKAVLSYLWEEGITDYRRFTSWVNRYYADKDRVMETVEASDVVTTTE